MIARAMDAFRNRRFHTRKRRAGRADPRGGAPSGPSGPIAAHCTLGLLKKYEKIIHGISHYTIISYFRSFGKSAACDLSLSSRRALQAVFLGSLCCRLGRACRESPCAPIGVSRSHTSAQKTKSTNKPNHLQLNLKVHVPKPRIVEDLVEKHSSLKKLWAGL